jgi:hypothetical protein
MNAIFNQTEGYLPGYAYPRIITDFSDYTGRPIGSAQQRSSNNGYSRYFSSDRYIYHIDPGPGLYNVGKKVEVHPMQMIGSLIDVYA